ncbi:MAG: M1 family metallopeptidase [Myxococcaceae bacterium]
MKQPAWFALVLTLCACATTAPAPATAAADPAPAAAAPKEKPKPPALRLPGDVWPNSYALELTVLPEEPHFSGKITIEATVKQETAVVWLNSTGLQIKVARLGGQQAAVLDGGEDFIGLQPATPLKPGTVRIEVEYSGAIDHEKSRGLYAEKEGADTYAYTFFEPIDARRTFPCFDEPSAKVPWKLTLHVKKEHLALANAPIELEAGEPNGMKEVQFQQTPPLPSYLVAFVVGPFELIDGGAVSGVPIHFIIPKGRAPELSWAKEITPKSVKALIDWFGSGYPYKKLDVAVVPRFWGTMEHPGIVAMGQPLSLIRPEQETRERKQRYLLILSHELAHYWFGDWVTTAWWNDTWLNEALGEWVDLPITDTAMPSWGVMEERTEIARAAMNADELPSTQAIRQPVETKEAIAASFDGDITYAKGATVLRMYESLAGPQKFQAFIRRYLQAHQNANATADDFLAAMKTDLGDQVSDGFRSFITQPGVPLVTGELDCSGKPLLRLKQRRSLPQGVAEPGAPLAWPVPVCVRTFDGKKSERTCTTLSSKPGDVTSLELPGAKCPSWVMLNDGAWGYYRSAVDLKLLRALFTKGSTEAKQVQPSVSERKMLLSDVRSAVRRGDVGVVDALELAPLAAADPSDRVAIDALELGALRTDVLDDDWFAKAKKYQLKTFGPLAKRLGWKRGADDTDDKHRLRQRALWAALYAKDPALLAEGAKLAAAWLKDPKTAGIDDELVPLALFAAAQSGGPALYDQLREAAKHAVDREHTQRLLVALGWFEDPKLVERSLALPLGSEFDLRETSAVVQVLLEGRNTRAQAWAWVQQNLDGMLAKMRSDESGWLLGGIAETFCDEAHRKEAAALLEPRAAKIDGAQALVTRGLEGSDRCIRQEARDREAIRKFLGRQK